MSRCASFTVQIPGEAHYEILHFLALKLTFAFKNHQSMIYVFWKYLKNWFSREMLIFMDLLQVDGTHSDPERDAGGQRFEDVLREEVRIREMLNGPAEGHDAVLIKEIHKVKAALS